MPLPEVVVTGLGSLTPIGNSTEAYWSNLIAGVSGAGLITKFDTVYCKTKFACELKGYDPKQYFSPKEAKRLDPFSQYAMIASDEAVRDARLLDPSVDKERVGIVWGSGIGGLDTTASNVLQCAENPELPGIEPYFIPKILPSIPAGSIAIKYGFKGPNYGTISACASSSHAVISAFQIIRLGEADIVIAGGSEAPITPIGIWGFNALRALSQRNEDYLKASCPFDQHRDGFVMGEGSGAMVLESLEHAKKRDARIYAQVVGTGTSTDAHHITAPDVEGVALALQRAISSARISKSDIDHINAHGTSTLLGDLNEIKAIQRVFGEDLFGINISATKSSTGHLLGASGIIESIATVLALVHQVVPPTINHTITDPAIDKRINLTLHQAVKRKITYAQNNAFGFGGHNASIIFKRWEG